MLKPYYDHNGITIYHGNRRDVLATLPTDSVDAVVTDPPYGVGMDYSDDFEDTLEYVRDVVAGMLPEAERVSRGAVLLTAGKFETELFLYRQFPPKWRLCWHKGATSNISAVGFNDWEMVMVYGKKVCVSAHDYFKVAPEYKGTFGHPCPKPIGYSLWLISRFTKEGGAVLDPFMGSGTTLRAAKDLGRKAIGIEIEEAYCEIAARRLSQECLPLGMTA